MNLAQKFQLIECDNLLVSFRLSREKEGNGGSGLGLLRSFYITDLTVTGEKVKRLFKYFKQFIRNVSSQNIFICIFYKSKIAIRDKFAYKA